MRSRERLLSAAAELIAARDPADVSITDIATAAGVSRPTVYLHFQDRETLFAEVVRTRLQSLTSRERGTVVERSDAERSIGLVVKEIGSNQDFYRKLLGAQSNSRSREQVIAFLREEVGRYFRRQKFGDAEVSADQSRMLDEEALFVIGGMVTVLSNWLQLADIEDASEQRRLSARLWSLISSIAESPR